MSKIIIEIETTEDAQRAQKVIAAILGTSVAEEPKKEVAKKAEEPKKEVTKKAEEPKKEVELDEVEPDENDELGEDTVDLATLTSIAKDAVSKSDRATVKDVIGKYGDKLSSVKESDYAALAKDLKAL